MRAAVGDAQVVVLQGYISYRAPWLMRSDKIIVVDLYDPLHLEQLEQLGDRPPLERQALLDLTVRVLNEQLVRGDFFLCASEEQRHLWLGHLGALGRLNPLNYEADHTLRSLIDVCPFGLAATPPHAAAARDQGRGGGHRRRRQGDPLGRWRLQLVRPAHAGARRRPRQRPRTTTSGCSSSA